jgi:hypothetical protein
MDQLFIPNSPVFIVLFIWSMLWRGIALWKAAQFKQKNWFIALLIINTAGILEILYLFKFAKKPLLLSELRFWQSK